MNQPIWKGHPHHGCDGYYPKLYTCQCIPIASLHYITIIFVFPTNQDIPLENPMAQMAQTGSLCFHDHDQFHIQCLSYVILCHHHNSNPSMICLPTDLFSHEIPLIVQCHSRILRNSRFFLGFCRSFPMVPPKGCLEHEEELAADFPDHGFVCEYQGRCAWARWGPDLSSTNSSPQIYRYRWYSYTHTHIYIYRDMSRVMCDSLSENGIFCI